MARTEEEKLAQAPVVVVLGGEEYEVKPLVIKDSRVWRQKVMPFLLPLPEYLTGPANMTLIRRIRRFIGGVKTDSFEVALNELLIKMPETVLDLFFEYARDLNREEIEGIATEAEIVEAFNKIVEVAFPLAQSLPMTVKTLSR